MWLAPVETLFAWARMVNFLLVVFGVLWIVGIIKWLE